MTAVGYSGTPLAKKLGIKERYSVLFINETKHYLLLFEDMPEVNYLTDTVKQSVDFPKKKKKL